MKHLLLFLCALRKNVPITPWTKALPPVYHEKWVSHICALSISCVRFALVKTKKELFINNKLVTIITTSKVSVICHKKHKHPYTKFYPRKKKQMVWHFPWLTIRFHACSPSIQKQTDEHDHLFELSPLLSNSTDDSVRYFVVVVFGDTWDTVHEIHEIQWENIVISKMMSVYNLNIYFILTIIYW